MLSLLDSFRPWLFLELGLSADWGEEFIKVVRTLEPESYEPANLADDLRTWFRRQRALFQDLKVLDELDDVPEKQSCTWHVVKNAMSCPPLTVGGRSFQLWSSARGDKEVFQATAERLSDLVEAAIERVQAELLDTPQCDWQCMSMKKWHASLGMDLDEADTFKKLVRFRFRRLCRLSHVNEDHGTRQFFQIMPILHAEFLVLKDRGEEVDNRKVWALIFKENMGQRVNRTGDISELRPFRSRNHFIFFGSCAGPCFCAWACLL